MLSIVLVVHTIDLDTLYLYLWSISRSLASSSKLKQLESAERASNSRQLARWFNSCLDLYGESRRLSEDRMVHVRKTTKKLHFCG